MIDDETGKPVGVMIELLKKLSLELGFTYTIEYQDDGQYGRTNLTADGLRGTHMIGKIVRREVDLALVPLSITAELQEHMDFTVSVMEKGIKILLNKPKYQPISIDQCFTPLKPMVWFMIAAALLLVSVTVTFQHYFNPAEYTNQHLDSLIPASFDYSHLPPEEVIHQWEDSSKEVLQALNLVNSIWNSLAAFLQQGSDVTPRSFPSRLVTAVWWLSCTIIISTYTANLAAFLTINRLTPEITSLVQLSQQYTIKYGVLKEGSTNNYFNTLKSSPYADMKPYLHLFNNITEGIKAVKHGKFAFIADSTILSYHVARDCSIMTVGAEALIVGHGLGLPLNSPYTKQLSEAILKLRMNGFIKDKLKIWLKYDHLYM
ncbi:uncharacterized protein TRIADDRAFT_30612 [Trichoplax adhaerens]|uniref:Ionotropic glutamate receptor C-terminal domain-containing protein n=1 Tax=Trichoplax adhaerens TaxID=10228 RepID=B3S7V0_TRIAD|nr:hypothetical protein TRIADDRAFT_30612 [Trichoplax adhaerens]EDV21257.1 hypothetical protein TRIADDRAFT_30612 [Trichoplax adhaerens]|eukprot:XP_002116224.1 hypothetical protein TRIADDRAFT_30612 [Trichoplax adhaerens]